MLPEGVEARLIPSFNALGILISLQTTGACTSKERMLLEASAESRVGGCYGDGDGDGQACNERKIYAACCERIK